MIDFFILINEIKIFVIIKYFYFKYIEKNNKYLIFLKHLRLIFYKIIISKSITKYNSYFLIRIKIIYILNIAFQNSKVPFFTTCYFLCLLFLLFGL